MSPRFIIETPPLVFDAFTPNLEDEFVLQLERCGAQLFPDYFLRQFKPLIKDRRGLGVRPDMVLVSRQLDSWYIVEVELACHPVSGHIAPQLDKLSQGIYDLSLVHTLEQVLPELSIDQLTDLLCREPGFLCVIDSYVDAVHTCCRENHFDLAVVEPYCCTGGQWAASVRQMPRALQPAQSSVGRYALKRRRAFGDKVFFELPGQFPSWSGSVSVISTDGEEGNCKLIPGSPRTLLVPANWVPERGSVYLMVVDPQRKRLRMEVD